MTVKKPTKTRKTSAKRSPRSTPRSTKKGEENPWKLTDVDHRILKIDTDPLFSGISRKEVADLVGCTVKRVSLTRDKEKYKAAKRALEANRFDIFLDAKIRAQERLVKLLDSRNADTVIRAAEKILRTVPDLSGLDRDPEVEKLAEAIEAIKDPRDWPDIIKRVTALTVKGSLSQDMAKTIAYNIQNWQTSSRVAKEYESALDDQKDEVWKVTVQDGEPVGSRMDELKEYPELFESPEDLAPPPEEQH